MQSSSRSNERRASKFAEGRLKLSTSCTECHRRKQKCDQKQPCRNCSRRYPPPQCIYRTLKDSSPPKIKQEPQLATGNGHIPLPSRPLKTESSSSSASDNNYDRDFTPDTGYTVVSRIALEYIEAWEPAEYQNLISSMVDHLGERLDSDGSSPAGSDSSVNLPKVELDYPASAGGLIAIYKRDKRRRGSVSAPSSFSISSVDPLHFLGITPTYQSGELLHAFVKVISKYVVSIDGRTTPNYYNDTWVPWAMKSPLLTYFAIFTAACYQSEAQKIPPHQSALVLGYKLKTIGLLNQMLRDPATSTGPEAITAVCYIITSEWYWSNYESVLAHLNGLKEMVRLKGGLGDVGFFLRGLVICVDYQIACSYDMDLNFPHNTATHVRYPAQISTPLIYSLISFTSIRTTLSISAETAQILDDMRLLLLTVIKAQDTPTPANNARIAQTAERVRSRVLALPDATNPASHLFADNIYKSTRTAAQIYIRAISTRTRLSQACTLHDLNTLWASMWRVSLTRWKQIPGIFLWILISGLQATQTTPHGRFLKSMYKAVVSYMAMEHFDVVDAALMGCVKVQRWLRDAHGDAEVKATQAGDVEELAYLHNYN